MAALVGLAGCSAGLVEFEVHSSLEAASFDVLPLDLTLEVINGTPTSVVLQDALAFESRSDLGVSYGTNAPVVVESGQSSLIPASLFLMSGPADGALPPESALSLAFGRLGLTGGAATQSLGVTTAELGLELSCDFDGDGEPALACGGADCDDSDSARAPLHPEVCDSVDHDCDGAAEPPTDGDGDGALLCQDCDDDNPARFPGNPEVCDGFDNDCDPATGDLEGDADGDGPDS